MYVTLNGVNQGSIGWVARRERGLISLVQSEGLGEELFHTSGTVAFEVLEINSTY